MCRFIKCILVVGLAGCSAEPLDREQALENLKSQAEEVRRATLEEDHEALAELTHPKLVEMFGGTTSFIQRMESIAAEMKGDGFSFTEIIVTPLSRSLPSAVGSGIVHTIMAFQELDRCH